MPPPRSAFLYTIPIGIILAIANQELGLNVITELIIGYLLPGRPIAMMMFKTWGYISMTQALVFASDFKLGHYMKIPPRSMFFCQVAATIVAGTVQLGVQAWLFSNVEGLCSDTQKDGFICPSTNVFGTASIIVRYIFPSDFVLTNFTLAVGCHWPATSFLARPDVLRPRFLLFVWCHLSSYSVDTAEKVQDCIPEIPQLPAHFHGVEYYATRNPAQLCALGRPLLYLQLRDPSPPLRLVG